MRIVIGSVAHDAEDMEALVRDYYARTIASQNMKPLKFKWHVYQVLENSGLCKLFTAREEGMLIGFALYAVHEHLHHDFIQAECTLLAVRPENRSHGIGKKLVQYAEHWFKEHGVSHMVHHYRVLYHTTPLFERLGFKLEDVSYVKEL